MHSSLAVDMLVILALLGLLLAKIHCFDFNFSSFHEQDSNQLILSSYSSIFFNYIQLVQDFPGLPIIYMSGRALYRRPFRLWSKKGINARFDTTFVLKIVNKTNPGGEGMAFIMTENFTLPENSNGQWLGISNIVSDGSPQANIVAIEFDTSKSYQDDIDNNHVGLDVNGIRSVAQVSLSGYGVSLSSGADVKVRIQYDGKNLTVFAGEVHDGKNLIPVLSEPIDLSAYLPKEVHVGFSASTSDFTQLACVGSWEFIGSDIKNSSNLLWLWITVPILALMLLIGIVFSLYWKMKCANTKLQDAFPSVEATILGSSTAPQKFRLKELGKATGEFNNKNKVGKGGFGTVYRGILRNKEVAVKRVSKNSTERKKDFIAEVTTIGNLHHRNLVKLIGWCCERQEFLLVYEFMPNGSLDKFIGFDQNQHIQELVLSWETRLSIISGVAWALNYLHNGCERTVLHRDIKASNILLDSEFNAKLGDFGLARIVKQSQQTHHSTKEIAGTPGYMAPEIFLTGKATKRTDVYAFGVLMLEVACGKEHGSQTAQNLYHSEIVNRVWELYRERLILDSADIRLNGEFKREEMECVLVLGLACCHPDASQRPSMNTVVQVLAGEALPPTVPAERPTFMWPSKPAALGYSNDSPQASHLSQLSELTGR